MKNITLSIAIVCIFFLFSYSQFQVDFSAGLTHQPTELSILRNGFYVSVAPSIPLKNKFRFQTTVQYRRDFSENFIDQDNIDLNPELQYDLFKFLTLGAGIYYSHSFNGLATVQGPNISPELGPAFTIQFKIRNAFLNLRYSRSVIEELEDYFRNDTAFRTTSFDSGYFQAGLGYTFAKKDNT